MADDQILLNRVRALEPEALTQVHDTYYIPIFRYLFLQVGDMATLPVSYSALVDKVIAIINAVVAVHAPYDGGVDLVVQSVELGPMTDPAGNQYFGADLAFAVEEIQN